ncbi:MAG: universal stress protein [Acidimicrobiales bacterium]
MTTEHPNPTANPDPVAEVTKVVIAVDDSAQSIDAVHAAYRFFGQAAHYTVVSIGRPPQMLMPMSPLGMEAPLVELPPDDGEAHLARERATEAADELPVGADVASGIGLPGEQVCRYAADHGTDVIVIGSHDRSIFDRLLHPSVGRYIVEHATCSVLIVR